MVIIIIIMIVIMVIIIIIIVLSGIRTTSAVATFERFCYCSNRFLLLGLVQFLLIVESNDCLRVRVFALIGSVFLN